MIESIKINDNILTIRTASGAALSYHIDKIQICNLYCQSYNTNTLSIIGYGDKVVLRNVANRFIAQLADEIPDWQPDFAWMVQDYNREAQGLYDGVEGVPVPNVSEPVKVLVPKKKPVKQRYLVTHLDNKVQQITPVAVFSDTLLAEGYINSQIENHATNFDWCDLFFRRFTYTVGAYRGTYEIVSINSYGEDYE